MNNKLVIGLGLGVIVILMFWLTPAKESSTEIELIQGFDFETMETSPVSFNDSLLLISFERPWFKSFGNEIVIYDLLKKKEISRLLWDKGLGSAIVIDDRLFVLGSSDWSKYSNCIYRAEIKYDEGKFRITDDEEVFCEGQNRRIFNTSVTKDNDGYVVAYEVDENKTNLFYTSFLKSTDMKIFNKTEIEFGKGVYTACPTIRFSNGYYYLFYLEKEIDEKSNVIYTTKMSVSKSDYKSFNRNNGIKILDPRLKYTEENNSESAPYSISESDFDIIGYNKHTYIAYADSDQSTRIPSLVVGLIKLPLDEYLEYLRNKYYER